MFFECTPHVKSKAPGNRRSHQHASIDLPAHHHARSTHDHIRAGTVQWPNLRNRSTGTHHTAGASRRRLPPGLQSARRMLLWKWHLTPAMRPPVLPGNASRVCELEEPSSMPASRSCHVRCGSAVRLAALSTIEAIPDSVSVNLLEINPHAPGLSTDLRCCFATRAHADFGITTRPQSRHNQQDSDVMANTASNDEYVPKRMKIPNLLIKSQKHRSSRIEDASNNDPRKYLEWSGFQKCPQ
jgi:hypothetical protein